jgi:dipeptidyl aminopeptidase/acylaminoacyl peptidase
MRFAQVCIVRRNGVRCVVPAIFLLVGAAAGWAQQHYQKPPKEILDVLDAPASPTASVSPARDVVLLSTSASYPTIADLAQPMLRLAGLRINPLTNGPHNPPRIISLTLKRISDGREIKVALPPDPHVSAPSWSPDGKHFAFTNATSHGIQLWIGDAATGATRQISGVALNPIIAGGGSGGGPAAQNARGACDWMPDNHTLLCKTVPAGRGTPPAEAKVPVGPNIQESFGKAAPAPTFEDLLQNPHDEDMFEFYAHAQLAAVDIATGKVTPVGKPAILGAVDPSPDGNHILVTRIHKPFSYILPVQDFPRDVEVWDLTGRVIYSVAKLPLAEGVPLNGVQTGPRSIIWKPTEPVTLVWVEALDDGNPRKAAPQRDKVMWIKAPFTGAPAEFARTQHRFAGLAWGERGDFAILRDNDQSRRWGRAWFLNPANPSEQKLVWDQSTQDRYRNPGTPVQRMLASGHNAIQQDGDFIFLEGTGATPEGDRPFLDRFNVKTLQAERIFRSDDKSYETVVALLAKDGSKLLTRHESPTDPPNYWIRNAAGGAPQAFTKFSDSTPQLRGIKKELVKYKRPDGLDLNFTLYLPADYKPGERRPAVFWAYPMEFTDADLGGQVTGSTNRFTTIRGYSELFFLLEGYVVMDNVAMPIIGDPVTQNNTYVEQITADAKAAIDKAGEMGVIDPNRVGVGGHSYGAFMTGNLLAHTNLFRAGIAESGAYNRTLTPFGFQTERRTLWEASDMYLKVSPFMFADKLKAPILLIHGEADNNSGTFPIQSERMYRAIKGNGGSVRYVTLPLEAHGYAARETIEHVNWEKLRWFDLYVKNAGQGTSAAGGAASDKPQQ